MIVMMAGLPASGKSTLCRILASHLAGAVLDKDEIRSALFSPQDIEYSTEQDDLCMDIMIETAAYILRKNPQRTVFLDGRPFSRRVQIERIIQAAEALHQPWRILQCICSEDSARKRLDQQARSGTHPAGDRDYQLYLRVKTQSEEITRRKTVVDTDQNLEICVQSALHSLS
jgi:adenylylsulfate kinase